MLEEQLQQTRFCDDLGLAVRRRFSLRRAVGTRASVPLIVLPELIGLSAMRSIASVLMIVRTPSTTRWLPAGGFALSMAPKTSSGNVRYERPTRGFWRVGGSPICGPIGWSDKPGRLLGDRGGEFIGNAEPA